MGLSARGLRRRSTIVSVWLRVANASVPSMCLRLTAKFILSILEEVVDKQECSALAVGPPGKTPPLSSCACWLPLCSHGPVMTLYYIKGIRELLESCKNRR